MPSDKDIADAILTHSLNLARVEAGLRNRVLKLIGKMKSDLVVKLNSQTLTEIGKADTNRLIKQANEIIEEYYQRAGRVVDIPELAINTAKATSQAIEAGILTAVSMPTDKYLLSLAGNVLIEGAPSAAWWAKQSADMQFRFASAVRQGLIAAETNQQIVRRVTDAIEVSRRNAAALVQTSVAAVASDARMAVYKENADLISSLTWLSTLDARVCLQCFPKDGLQWDMDYKPIGHSIAFQVPPQHFSCRCQMVPRTRMFDELGLSGARATAGGPFVGSFDEFLTKKGPGFQDKMFGPARASLWRDGKITRAQLLDNRGNELTMKQLMAKYNPKVATGGDISGDYYVKDFVKAPPNELTREQIVKINQIGLKHRDTGDFYSYYTPVFQRAYDIGQKGQSLVDAPVVEGIRFGKAPVSGISHNFKDDVSEMGLSLAQEKGKKPIASAMWFEERKAYEYRGVKVGVGSDGETIILPLHVENLD